MAFPMVSIISVSKSKISSVNGNNMIEVVFSFDADILEYIVEVDGNSYASGICADQGYGAIDLAVITGIPADTLITAQIDASEMYSEGSNRVNIYGKGLDGVWTLYDS